MSLIADPTSMPAAMATTNASENETTMAAESETIDIDALEEKNAELIQQLEKANAKIETLEKGVYVTELSKPKQSLMQVQQNNKGSSSLPIELRRMEAAHRDRAEKLRKAEAQVIDIDNKLQESRRNLQSLHAENERLQQKMKKNKAYTDQLLQNAIGDGRWVPVADEALRNQLNRLHSDTRQWARQWAHDGFQFSHIPKEEISEFQMLFSNFVNCNSEGSFPDAVVSPTPKFKGKMAQLLLTAALAHRIEVEFFGNPFFCVDPEQAAVLSEVFNEMQKVNFQEAHAWRCTTWRIYNPPGSANLTESERQIQQKTARCVHNVSEHIVVKFLTGPAGYLVRNGTESERNEARISLRNILINAAEIATSLWTQRSYIICMNMIRLNEEQLTFQLHSPLMEAHPLNKIEREKETVERDILIVTRPTILAFHDHDDKGIEGQHYRPLAKAIVFLDDVKSSQFL